MKKKIIGLILIVTFVCQLILPINISAIRYTENDINLLVALNLLRGDENGDLRLQDTLKRSEYTALILRMMGHDEITSSYADEDVFTDVSENHWAKGYIEFAEGINLIDGTSENTFEPDRPVSRSEAIKIIVSALGYTELAESKGGYPVGYEQIATKLKMLSNISSDGAFTRQNACQLILNSLTVDIMDSMGTVVSGANVLNQYLDTEIYEGYVTATYDIYIDKEIEKDKIEIDSTLYENKFHSKEELFGYKVRYYLKGKGTDGEIVYIKPFSSNEERLEIESDDIIETTNLETFNYYGKNKKAESVKLADNIILHYNGRIVSSVNIKEELLKPEQGSVLLFDKEDDGKYDFAVVNSYHTVIAQNISEERIIDVYRNRIDLEVAEDIIITKDNKEITLADLKNGDVLSVAESLDGERVKIIADYSVVNGKISGIEENDDEKTLFIESEDKNFETKLSKSYIDAIRKGLAENWQEPDSRLLTFYIDSFGDIADIKLADSQNKTDILQYGYLIEVGSKGSINRSAQIKVLTSENKFEIFDIDANKKVLLGKNSGIGYFEKRVDGQELCDSLGGSGSADRQIIKYRVENNILKEIYLADSSFNTDFISEDVASSYWTSRQGVLGQKYFMDKSTVVFAIPQDAVYEDVMAAGGYEKFFSDGTGYTCTLYDVENNHVGAIVIHDKIMIKYDSIERGFETILNYGSSSVLFIDKVFGTVDSNGEDFKTIEGWQNGEKIKVNISDDLANDVSAMSKLKPGKVIQYEKNTNEKSWAMTSDEPERLIIFEEIFDFNKDMGSAIFWDHDVLIKDLPGILTLWGTLDIVELRYCSVIVNENGTEKTYTIPITNKAVFLKYNHDNHKFEQTTRYELVAGQRIYMAKQSSNQIIVVY